MFGLGFWELLFILVIVLVLFGVKRIPQLGSSLGQGIKNFTSSFKEETSHEETPDSIGSGSGASTKPEGENQEKTVGENR